MELRIELMWLGLLLQVGRLVWLERVEQMTWRGRRSGLHTLLVLTLQQRARAKHCLRWLLHRRLLLLQGWLWLLMLLLLMLLWEVDDVRGVGTLHRMPLGNEVGRR
ncbi:hypothetical protein CAOG_009872 [Capsaspora owczarzaki ATCC 30864]|uniref:Uncharacterized protein n=1 Tax=Capsaspora owczarzaki (strain ATCC 30864) TaxID=595528 RepID=A0A0D2WTR4_CAPO3|nr:hypothetical protein CAOG_009872 [Capsaspora owczarzaki ATCC 30864]